ncbi:unnamed protein product [Schistocephalus solidus]|uniref:BAH domain-containing protein n=1 Tax=Schistocephalus solidus TaxID=70667 RepID=A0A183TE65_SCHSO|nr:unnamed protein product [Schistocephalus solidus]
MSHDLGTSVTPSHCCCLFLIRVRDAATDTRWSVTGIADFPPKTFACASGVCGDEKGLTDTASSFSCPKEAQHAESLTVVVKGFSDECPDNTLSPSANGPIEVGRTVTYVNVRDADDDDDDDDADDDGGGDDDDGDDDDVSGDGDDDDGSGDGDDDDYAAKSKFARLQLLWSLSQYTCYDSQATRATSSISPSTSSLTTADTFSPSIRATSTGGPSAEMSPSTKHHHESVLGLPEEDAEFRKPPTSVWVDAAAAHTWNHDEEQVEGLTRLPNPPAEPSILKLQRIDLDLSDLSDGLRILLIEDTHLRAGTLYSVASSEGEESHDFVDRTSALNRLFRIQLDGEKPVSTPSAAESGNRLSPGRSTASKTSALSPGPVSSFGRGTERRRQGEAILQAWQLPQQAVLEVIPAFTRQLPPGTRVCASWSEKLAAYLYPGKVSDKDSRSTSEPDSVCVSFDDGDEREVHISKIRILPDNFANLAELREAAAFPSPLSPENFARARHASASSALFKSSKRRPRQSVDRLNPVSSVVSEPGSLVCPVPRSQSMSLKRRRMRIRREISVDLDGPSQLVDIKAEDPCNVANEHVVEHENQSDLVDINGTSAANPAKVATPTILWKPKGKTRRRYQGMYCYRALERKTDGLRVFVGDVVEFNSGRNGTVYLGEVRQICYAPESSAPVVFASWFYYPDEAGPDGRLVEGWKGAIFSSSHTDENEAECIIGRVGVAPTLADFISANEEHLNRRAKKTSQRTRSDAPQTSDQELGKNTYRQPKPPSKRRRREATSQLVRKDFSPESSEEDQADVPRYFVAGKFDPVGNRVLSWDADLARTLQLPSEVDNLTFTSSDPDHG